MSFPLLLEYKLRKVGGIVLLTVISFVPKIVSDS